MVVLRILLAWISKTVSFAVWLMVVSLAGPFVQRLPSLSDFFREVYLAMSADMHC
jgi:hypothetical protein